MIAGRVQRFREHDRLVHRAIHIHLREAEVGGIEIEQTEHAQEIMRTIRIADARRGKEKFVVAAFESQICRLQRMRRDLEARFPTGNDFAHRDRAWRAGRRCGDKTSRQIEIKYNPECAQQFRIRIQGSESLVEIEQFLVVGKFDARAVFGCGHVVKYRERQRDRVIERRAFRLSRDQSFAVQRPGRPLLCSEELSRVQVSGGRAQFVCLPAIPMHLQSVHERGESVAITEFLSAISEKRFLRQSQLHARFLVDRFQRAQCLSHRKREAAALVVIVERFVRTHVGVLSEKLLPQIRFEQVSINRERASLCAALQFQLQPVFL